MGTKASIGMVTDNGKVKCVGVQFSGMIDWTGKQLLANYNDKKSISKLMKKGYIWSLGESVETTKYGLDVDGWTEYNSDKPEIRYTTEAGFFGDELWYKCGIDAEYRYLFKDGEWWVCYDNDAGEVIEKIAKCLEF